MRKLLVIVLFLIFIVNSNIAQEIKLFNTDATVWSRNQTIVGELSGISNSHGSIFVNGIANEFIIPDQQNISINITLNEGLNTIHLAVDHENELVASDTLKLTLGYNIRPEVFAYATVENSTVLLHAKILENPDSSNLDFMWEIDPTNPSLTSLNTANDSITTITLDASALDGEYYYNVYVSNNEDTVRARTFFTLKDEKIIPFNIYTDYSSWIDSAIIYEITPYNFVNPRGDFKQVKKKIPDFVRLGVNTLWIQPIYETRFGGQGYDVTNYFIVRDDYGTEKELRELIEEAKRNNLRVIFDFVANHSSIAHPYAIHASENGEESHYWDYYQRKTDDTPYSQHYSFYNGFINYFWDQLPNLNFNNPEVIKWMEEAIRYWIEEFDIDGYRFDAVWGVNARNPQFMKDIRHILKRYKPEILMLAEDKATWEETFDKNFDLAFDWAPEESWVSQWTWQTNYSEFGNQTIFNSPSENSRQRLLRAALTNNGRGYSPSAKVLRFMGNNDIPHFITHHGVKRTKMAALLLFSLPGVPMIYNGQEIGIEGHPYSTEFLFFPGYPIDYNDPKNLFPFYKRLIEIRSKYPALLSDNYEELITSNDNYTFAFRRWTGDQNLITVMNMRSAASDLTIKIPTQRMNLESETDYYLTELISGEVLSGNGETINELIVSMEGFQSKVFLLADSVEIVTDIEEGNYDNKVNSSLSLLQNYPNPFNPNTNIKFNIPQKGKVELSVYNLLGEKIDNLKDEILSRGTYTVQFNGGGLASGIYLVQLRFGGNALTKKMFLVK